MNDIRTRNWIIQILALVLMFSAAFYFLGNAQTNIAQQNIASGFGFLEKEAGFAISQSFLDYSAASNYATALWVGISNTLIVALLGITFSILLGVLMGMARLSNNTLLAGFAATYVELLRNIPLLLQLFFWYALFTEGLPSVRDAIEPLPHVFLSNKGFQLPFPQQHDWYQWVAFAFLIAIALSLLWKRWSQGFQNRTGTQLPNTLIICALLFGLPFVTWALGGFPLEIDVPVQTRFRFRGGLNISPEFAALLLGLTLYTAAFVAEIVRSGIQAVDKGQREAAESLGLKPSKTMQLVILPQALRVIIPPLISQMLNLTKNSSLAVAIGYPDLVSIAQTTINQTGQAIEAIAILMSVYLALSLITSLIMNWYNKSVALVGDER